MSKYFSVRSGLLDYLYTMRYDTLFNVYNLNSFVHFCILLWASETIIINLSKIPIFISFIDF